MERFVIGAALATAGLFALGSVTGNKPLDLNIHIGDGGWGISPTSGSGGVPVSAQPQAFAASSFQFEDGFAVIHLVPEDRTDFAVSMTNTGPLPAPVVRLFGQTVVVDGEVGGRLRRCTDNGMAIDSGEDVTFAAAPQIYVRAPLEVAARIYGAGVLQAGPSAAMDVSLSGCQNATLGDVKGALRIERAGSGGVTAGTAGSADVEVAGSAVVRVGAVADGLKAELAGSGAIEVASVTGDASVAIAGSGSVKIAGGALNTGKTEIAGSGDVFINAPVGRLSTETMGSGDVEVTGAVGDLDVEVAGSGDVWVMQVTGNVTQNTAGSGSVKIGQRKQ